MKYGGYNLQLLSALSYAYGLIKCIIHCTLKKLTDKHSSVHMDVMIQFSLYAEHERQESIG